MSMGWDYVSKLWPPLGLLIIPQVTYEYAETGLNYIDRKKTYILNQTSLAILNQQSHLVAK
jgi:hypothetical protein